MHTPSKQLHCVPHLCIYRLQRRRFVTSYVQPVVQQYKSTPVLKRTFVIKVATMKATDDSCNKWKPSHAYHKIDTFRGEQGHKGGL